MTTATKPAKLVGSKSKSIPVNDIFTSPFDRREGPIDVEELSESIAQVGLITPIGVRSSGSEYELIYGHRRLAACQKLGWTEIRADVYDVDDATARLMQFVENVQREDLDPIEEGMYCRDLLQDGELTGDDVAQLIGKSRKYVALRVAIANLPAKAQKAYRQGHLTLGALAALTRVQSPKTQESIVADLLSYRRNDETPETGRDVDHLAEKYRCNLSDAPFDLDADPPCAGCPKRRSAQSLLFEDKASEDQCLDPECWLAKTKAWSKAKIAEAEKDPTKRVLTKAEIEDTFSPYGHVRFDSDFFGLDEVYESDPKRRTLRDLLSSADGVETAVGIDATGKYHEVIEKRGIAAKLRAAGHDFNRKARGKKASKAEDKAKEQARLERKERKLRRDTVAALSDAVARATKVSDVLATSGKRVVATAFLDHIANSLPYDAIDGYESYPIEAPIADKLRWTAAGLFRADWLSQLPARKERANEVLEALGIDNPVLNADAEA